MQFYDNMNLGDEMIDKLIDDILKYIEFLRKNNMYISIHTDFTEYMMKLIEFNIHTNPKCLMVKSDNDRWNECIRMHETELVSDSDVIKRKCFAGVNELIFKLNCGGSVCVSFAEGKEVDNAVTFIKPLCRMIEYLKMICPETEDEITDNEIVNRAIKFIQRNFYNKISNEDIARVCSCSLSTVCHLFKKHKGISIHKFILDKRILYAKELLRTSNLSVSSVAAKSGFSDYNYFSSKFKRETGISPSDYRKNIFY